METQELYVIVLWEDENMYSIVNRKKVVSGLDDDKLIGLQVPIVWGKSGELQTGKVINTGTKKEMRAQEKVLVQAAVDLSFEQGQFENDENLMEGMNVLDAVVQAPELRKKRKHARIKNGKESVSKRLKNRDVDALNIFNSEHVAILDFCPPTDGFATSASVNADVNDQGSDLLNVNNDEVPNDVAKDNNAVAIQNFQVIEIGGGIAGNQLMENGNCPETEDTDPYQLLTEKNEQIRALELQLSKSEQQNRVIKKLLKQRGNVEEGADDSEMEDIGHGVMVARAHMEYLRLSFKTRPSIFMRQLVFESGLFTLKEVADCSLQGKWIQRKEPGRPGLNQKKWQAAKEATIRMCGLKPFSWEMAQFEKKLKPICSDARKKFNRELEKTLKQ